MADRPVVLEFAELIRRYCKIPHKQRVTGRRALDLSEKMDVLLPKLTRLEYDRLRLMFLKLEEGD